MNPVLERRKKLTESPYLVQIEVCPDDCSKSKPRSLFNNTRVPTAVSNPVPRQLVMKVFFQQAVGNGQSVEGTLSRVILASRKPEVQSSECSGYISVELHSRCALRVKVTTAQSVFHFTTVLSHLGFLPWKFRVAFPGESQQRQSRSAQLTVHAWCF